MLSATLAGIVENPTQYDPIANPALSLVRRNTVLARIAQTNPKAHIAMTAWGLTARTASATDRTIAIAPNAVRAAEKSSDSGHARR